MTALSFVPPVRSGRRAAPILRGLRRGGSAFVQEVRSEVPALARRRSRPGHAPADRRAGRGESGRMRLTDRGRVVLVGIPLTLGLILAACALLVIAAPSTATAGTDPVEGAQARAVVVQPGQSLWELAQAAQPDQDPRRTVSQIVELNDLHDAQVAPGQRVLLPVS